MKRVLPTLAAVLAVLALSAGPATAKTRTARCTVPNLSGVSLKVVRQRLAHAHCAVGRIHRPTAASGNLIVTRQAPKAGAHRKHDAKVTVWLTAKTTPPVTLTAPTSTTPTPSPAVRANIDPSYTQDQTNPLMVTWAYSAGVTDGTLPYGTLSLTVYEHGQVASAGGCTIDVGGTTIGGNCTLTLPAYGLYDVTVSYASSSATVAPSTATDTEDIEAPPPPPPPPAPAVVTVTSAAVFNGGTEVSSCDPCGAGFYLQSGYTLVVYAQAAGTLGVVQGAVEFTLSPSTGYTESGGPEGSNWFVGSDCSAIPASGPAADGCQMTFTSDGIYRLSLGYNSSDPGYASTTGPTITVTVSG